MLSLVGGKGRREKEGSMLVHDTDKLRGQAAQDDFEAEALEAQRFVITGFGSSGEAIAPMVYESQAAAIRDARHFRDEGWSVRLRRFFI